ncbi:heavy-metal-binding-domain-containing protein [Apiospora aurea]|uniref:Heavy-metal-binding-domain-containing protein n=1 Tax=Apiospora aurea TaxID=335848 RepID=A0ABR1QYY7_9PEZI
MLSNRKSMLAVPAPNRASAFSSAATPPQYSQSPQQTHPFSVSHPESEPHSGAPSVPTSTTSTLPGYRVVRTLGAVYGSTTCARKDTKSLLKSVTGFGSEAKSLTHLLYNAREQATARLVVDCLARGGNAVVGLGYGESEILGFAQVSVYGTAVYVEKEV